VEYDIPIILNVPYALFLILHYLTTAAGTFLTSHSKPI